jgi:uncharacterized protein YjiS (DUF1127 family)
VFPQWHELLRRWTGHDDARGQTHAHRYAEAEAELQALSERELADLGIARGEIAHAVRHGRTGFVSDVIRPSALRANPSCCSAAESGDRL